MPKEFLSAEQIPGHPGFSKFARHVKHTLGSKKAHLLRYLEDISPSRHPANRALMQLEDHPLVFEQFVDDLPEVRNDDQLQMLVAHSIPLLDTPLFIGERPAFEYYADDILPQLKKVLSAGQQDGELLWEPASGAHQQHYENPRLPNQAVVRKTRIYFQTEFQPYSTREEYERHLGFKLARTPHYADDLNNDDNVDSEFSKDEIKEYIWGSVRLLHRRRKEYIWRSSNGRPRRQLHPWAQIQLAGEIQYRFQTLRFFSNEFVDDAGDLLDYDLIPSLWLLLQTRPKTKMLPVYLGIRFEESEIEDLKRSVMREGDFVAPGFQIW